MIIDKIEIGNESSAFIEILASRAENADQHQTLVPVTSFMNPSESKSGTNTNRVKIFSINAGFNDDIAKQKWDRIKIVCTQPFNKVNNTNKIFVRV